MKIPEGWIPVDIRRPKLGEYFLDSLGQVAQCVYEVPLNISDNFETVIIEEVQWTT